MNWKIQETQLDKKIIYFSKSFNKKLKDFKENKIN